MRSKLLRKGFSTDVESGLFDLHVEATLEGGGNETQIEARASGPFSNYHDYTVPNLDWEVSLDAQGLDFDGRVIATEENAFIEYGGDTYEVGTEGWQGIWDDALATDGPRTFREAGVDPADWVQDAELDEVKVDGQSFDEVTGTLDVAAMLDGFRELTPAADRAGLPSGDRVESIVADPEFSALIGEDGIWRRLEVELDFDAPEGNTLGGIEDGEVRLEATLSEPNQPQSIELPDSGRPLPELLDELGIPPEALLGPGAQAPQTG